MILLFCFSLCAVGLLAKKRRFFPFSLPFVVGLCLGACQKDKKPEDATRGGFSLTDDWEPVLLGPEERKAPLYVGASEEPRPLYLMLHGYGSTGEKTAAFLNVKDSVFKKGAHLLLPDGRINSQGRRFWDATPACCEFEADQTDIDELYLRDLIVASREVLGEKISKVVLVGYSNGSFMAQRLACRQRSEVDTVFSFVGAGYQTPEQCQGADSNPKPVAMVHIHGEWDPLVFYGGGVFRASYPSAPDTVRTWSLINGCDGEPQEFPRSLEMSFSGFEVGMDPPPEGVVDLPLETDLRQYKSCKAPTLLMTMRGLGHVPLYRPDLLDYVESVLAQDGPI